MALTTAQLSLIEQRVTNDGPSAGVAYLMWFFLGLAGGHRFYLGRTGSAVAQLLLSITFFGLLVSGPWVLIDVFLISGMIREKREAIRQKLMMDFITGQARDGHELPMTQHIQQAPVAPVQATPVEPVAPVAPPAPAVEPEPVAPPASTGPSVAPEPNSPAETPAVEATPESDKATNVNQG